MMPPVLLSAEELQTLFDSIDTSHVVGLRDRALIAAMFYSFGRVSAVIGMQVKDYFPKDKCSAQWPLVRKRLKGGTFTWLDPSTTDHPPTLH